MKKALEGDYPKPILIEDLGRMYPTKNSKQKKRFGVYKCGFCGNEFKTQVQGINIGNTKSCGCYNKRRTKEANRTHGLKYTRLYGIWKNIKSRTLNLNYKRFEDYGGRGITICDEWKNDFMSFYNWAINNGYVEGKKLSLDRIDVNGNYCPDNCRWVDDVIQARNRRISINSTSGYKGVHPVNGSKYFISRICIEGTRIYLGSFKTAEEGAIAYNNYIIENNLEGFILNEIPEEHLEKGDHRREH